MSAGAASPNVGVVPYSFPAATYHIDRVTVHEVVDAYDCNIITKAERDLKVRTILGLSPEKPKGAR